MGTKTISITDSAYQRLAQEKRAGESFTDVILRLTGRRSLRELSEIVSPDEASALASAIDGNRENRRQRRKSRLRETI